MKICVICNKEFSLKGNNKCCSKECGIINTRRVAHAHSVKNREKERNQAREWYKRNPDKIKAERQRRKEYHREYQKTEKYKAWVRSVYYKYRQRAKEYRDANKERSRKIIKEWGKNHRERIRAYSYIRVVLGLRPNDNEVYYKARDFYICFYKQKEELNEKQHRSNN